MEWSLVVSIAFGVTQMIIAIVQTVRLRTLQRVRDTHLHLLWRQAKKLSHNLLLEPEEKVARQTCGARAQRIEESIATLIVNLSNLKEATIDKWYESGDIDDFDKDLLRQLTRSK